MKNYVDVIIPRGGKSLVKKVLKKSVNFNYWTLRGLMSCLCRSRSRFKVWQLKLLKIQK